ncbi:hypothetical protein C6499_22485 [Candidatus Poribacteria bacterium]|nr:MAG: hypothetical protein C6499_22485 [Candidatus Poribacteria bacterium]
MLFRESRINNDDELYPRYWSEFVEYYIANGLSLSSVGVSDRGPRPKSYYFRMDNFDHFHISLGVFLLGDSEISANINLNKQIEQNRDIFEALRSAQDIFQRDFDEELLFLPDRPRIYIIGCKTQADQRAPNDWSNQFQWLCTNIERLNKVFLGPLKITQYYEQTRLPQ